MYGSVWNCRQNKQLNRVSNRLTKTDSIASAMSPRLITGDLRALTKVDIDGAGKALLTQYCNMALQRASTVEWSLSMACVE